MRNLFKRDNRLLIGAYETERKNIAYILILPIFLSTIGGIVAAPLVTITSFISMKNLGLKLAFDLIINTGSVIVTYFLWIRLFEKRKVKYLGLSINKSSIKKYIKGFGIGLLLMLINTVIIVFFCGGSISLSCKMNSNFIVTFIFIIIGWMIQGAEEEIIIRGHMMPMLSKSMPVIFAIIISSSYFSILHLTNPSIGFLPILNLFLFAFSMCIYALIEESLLGVCAIHSSWNFLQGNVFGFAVSGLDVNSYSIFKVTTKGTIFDGSKFGPEGGLIKTMVISIFIIILIFKYIKKIRGLNKLN